MSCVIPKIGKLFIQNTLLSIRCTILNLKHFYCQFFRKSETSWSSIDDVFSLKSDMNKSYPASTKERLQLDHVIFCWPIHGRIDIQMLLLEIFYHHDLNIEQNPNQVEWISLRLISPTLISTHQVYISTISSKHRLRKSTVFLQLCTVLWLTKLTTLQASNSDKFQQNNSNQPWK